MPKTIAFLKKVTIGGFGHVRAVRLGRGAPLVLQTMWKDKIKQNGVAGALERIERLGAMGCGLLRFAVPDMAQAEALGALAAITSMPLVADIHFDYKLALRCMDFPIAKIRVNPGNLGGKKRTAAVLNVCKAKNIPVRIGINSGSLPAGLRAVLRSGSISVAEALVAAAERELELFDEHDFYNVVVSMKSSSIEETIQANELFASRYELPLHIGLTEAGPLVAGTVRNTAALFGLLKKGIGDTVRVSLSDSMENEIIAAKEIALAANRLRGVRLISCPRCGRCGFDTHLWTSRWQELLTTLNKDITVAVMGCAVNGPGEAREADIGITGAGNKIIIFKYGKIVRTVTEAEADAAFREELERF